MHICILTQYYPPEIGAPQARLSELSEFLIKKGNAVSILTAVPNYPTGRVFKEYNRLYSFESKHNLKIHRSFIIPSISTSLILRLISYFSFLISSFIVGLTKLKKCDVIIVESPPLFLGLSGYLLSRLKNAKLIFNVSDLWPDSFYDMGLIEKKLAYNILKNIEEFIYNKSDIIMGQSRGIVSNIEMRFPKLDIFHFSNGVNTSTFNVNIDSNIFETYLSSNKIKIVYAGLHGVAQGLMQILLTANSLRKINDDFHFFFIGDGPEKKKLLSYKDQKKINNVTFIEPQKREMMPGIWSQSDIAIVSLSTLIYGAVPSKLYEIMSSGIPVVLIANGEPKEIVNLAKSGLVVEPGDIPNILNSILKMKDLNVRYQFGENGRRFVKKYYNRKVILKSFLEKMESKFENN